MVPVSAVGLKIGSIVFRSRTVLPLDRGIGDTVKGKTAWMVLTVVPWILLVFGVSVWSLVSYETGQSEAIIYQFGAFAVAVSICSALFISKSFIKVENEINIL